MNQTEAWKILILQRYAGEFQPAEKECPNPIKKTSEDIAFDLSGMGEFTADEVSAYMAVNGYTISFDDDKPVWLLQPKKIENALLE